MSLLGGLIQKDANNNLSISADTYFSGNVVLNATPENDDTVVLSMSGNSVDTDLSGYKRVITKTGDIVEAVDGTHGNYASMTSAGSFISVDLDISGTSSFSVGFWLYLTAASANKVISIGRHSSPIVSEDRFFAIEVVNSRLTAFVSHYTNPSTIASGGSMSVSLSGLPRWYNVAFTYDSVSKVMKLYIDNVLMNTLVRTNTSLWEIPEGKGILRAGADASGNALVNTRISRINVSWGRVWNTEDINGLYVKNWKPKQEIKETFASKVNPVFTGTIDVSGGLIMPPIDDVTINAPRANDTTLVFSQDETVSILTDASRYARVATKTSDVSELTDPDRNKIALLSGATSYIESDIGVTGVNSLGVSFWINPSVLPINKVISIGNYNDFAVNNGILKFWVIASGEISYIVNSTTYTTTNVGIVINTWTHIVITLDGTSGILKVYKDGVQVYVSPSALTIASVPEGNGILRIGSTGPNDVMFINNGTYSDSGYSITGTLVANGAGYLNVGTASQTATSVFDVTFGNEWTICMDIINVANATYYTCGSNFWAYSDGSGSLRTNIYGTIHTFDNGTVPTGARTQLTITYNSTTNIRTMYIDGVLRSSIVVTPSVGALTSVTGKFVIFGTISDSGSKTSQVGQQLHYVYVFNRIISTTEMLTYKNAVTKLAHYPNSINTTSASPWKIGHVNIAWGRVWTQTDIDDIYSVNEWLPRLTLADTFVMRSNPEFIALDQPLEDTYAPISNPVFTGTVSLPTATTLNGISLATTIDAKANLANPTFTGNVGIGTTNPQAPLHVVGNAIISDGILTSDISFQSGTTITERPDGTIYTLTAWTSRTIADAAHYDVAWSSQLEMFVTATNGSSLYSSSDGITWTPQTIVNGNWANIIWVPELSIFVLLSTSGTIATSSNGTSWQTQTTPTSNQFTDIAWAPELGLFAVVSSTGTLNNVITSPNGVTWTSRATPNHNWTGIAWAPELGLFAAVSPSGVNNFAKVMTSVDGITWITRNTNDNAWQAIAWAPELGLFASVSTNGTGNRVMTSSDGITWITRTSAADNFWRDITWVPEIGLFVAVSSSGNNRIMTSSDGINWKSRKDAASNQWRGVAWSPELRRLVAIADSGTANRIMTADAQTIIPKYYIAGTETWVARPSASLNSWSDVVWAPELGVFVAVSDTGTSDNVMTSSTGLTWVSRQTPPNSVWRSIAWSAEQGIFTAVGESTQQRENPAFITDNTTLASDFATTYGWDTNIGWVVSASSVLSGVIAMSAFNKTTTNFADCWHSDYTTPSVASPQWLRIQYPYSVVITSYSITSRNESINAGIDINFPTRWVLQGSNDGTTWINLESTRYETTWNNNFTKTYTAGINTNKTAFTSYRLLIQGSRRNNSDATNAYVAIGEWRLYTITSGVMTSSDAITWVTRATPANKNWGTIEWAPSPVNLFVALAYDGYTSGDRAITSPDGITWTARNTPLYNEWRSIAWSSYLNLFTAVASNVVKENPAFATNTTLTSNFGTTYGWNTNTGWVASASSVLDGTTSAHGAFNKTAVNDNDCWHSINTIAVSSSNPQWLQITYPTAVAVIAYNITSRNSAQFTIFPTLWRLQAYNGSSWINLETTRTETTWDPAQTKSFTNGINSTVQTYTQYRLFIEGARHSNTDASNNSVAIGNWTLFTRDAGGGAMTSPNGTSWTSQSSIPTNTWQGITWSPERSLFVAVADSGTYRVTTSSDGTTWTTGITTVANEWHAITWASEIGQFVAVAETGTGNRIMTSIDGTTWTTRTSPANNQWRSIAWAPELGVYASVAGSVSPATSDRVMTIQYPYTEEPLKNGAAVFLNSSNKEMIRFTIDGAIVTGGTVQLPATTNVTFNNTPLSTLLPNPSLIRTITSHSVISNHSVRFAFNEPMPTANYVVSCMAYNVFEEVAMVHQIYHDSFQIMVRRAHDNAAFNPQTTTLHYHILITYQGQIVCTHRCTVLNTVMTVLT